MWYTALLIGITGSLHCAGMCSPLLMAVTNLTKPVVINRLVYNTGRIFIYGILGGIFSGAGSLLPISPYQSLLSLLFGVVLIAMALLRLNYVSIPDDQVHIMKTDLPDPNESALQYESILQKYFGKKDNSFDLLLLGMGDDGHTLSLFPGTEVVHETRKWCTSFFLEQQDMFRITLTKSIANRSACVLFLTTGKGKANALQHVLNGPTNINLYPAQTIQPENGETHWIIDTAAASLLAK